MKHESEWTSDDLEVAYRALRKMHDLVTGLGCEPESGISCFACCPLHAGYLTALKGLELCAHKMMDRQVIARSEPTVDVFTPVWWRNAGHTALADEMVAKRNS